MVLKRQPDSVEGEAKDAPSRAYYQEVVEEIHKGEQGECPICLEAFEDAVLTPCVHHLCRECLLASWQNFDFWLVSGLQEECKQARSNYSTESQFYVDIEKNWVESSKIVLLLLCELECLRSSGSKSIVFSQWTAFLDLLHIYLSRSNIPFLRLDGTLINSSAKSVKTVSRRQ